MGGLRTEGGGRFIFQVRPQAGGFPSAIRNHQRPRRVSCLSLVTYHFNPCGSAAQSPGPEGKHSECPLCFSIQDRKKQGVRGIRCAVAFSD
jgi:hypothetical protein